MKRFMTTADIAAWLTIFAYRVDAETDRLSELDAATGDADHGANLRRGMAAIRSLIDAQGDQGRPGEYFKQVGLTIVDTVGGSSGALYGTIFLRFAATVGPASDVVDAETMAAGLEAACQGIVDRGRARAGDKTMYDALEPAARAFRAAFASGEAIEACWRSAAKAAAAGAAATASMRARRGKSSYVGEKSIGTVDPGAASVAMLIAAASEAVSTSTRH
jgi:dihydroxyacetone kinase-like protein